MDKLPHFLTVQLSQPALPPNGNKQAHCSFRCQPPAQIQATGDAPLSPGAETPSPPPPPSLFFSVSTSLPPFISASQHPGAAEATRASSLQQPPLSSLSQLRL